MTNRTPDYNATRRRTEESCIVTYEPEKCYNGYTLFSNYRGSTFYLMDMEGHIVHTWHVRTAKVAELLPNGHLMYGHMWNGVAEADWDSNEMWYYPCTQHHDFCVMPNGHVMVLCGIRAQGQPERPITEKRTDPKIMEGASFGTAYFIEVDPKNNERLWEWWADEHIEELREIGVEFPRTGTSDVFHSNTCEVLPETELGRSDPRFRAGNVVFSHLRLDTVGVIDKATGRIVWAWGPGVLSAQHMPTLIPDAHPITDEPMPGAGHFLIFDNGWARKYSTVIELDPRTNEIMWEYKDPDNFYGRALAGADRMPNGNTVICEGANRGRLFEVTPDGEVVWDYLTPYIDGKAGWYQREDISLSRDIYRCVRYPASYVEGIMEAMEKE